ncbi:hypothetical protein E4U19_006735 [Claviceps sp. Clav32 group G5]|nr:hypothetical protein E4U19_006735 [Claviceps sp. Clav32 group G5]
MPSLKLTGSQRGAPSRAEHHFLSSPEPSVGERHETVPSRDILDGSSKSNRDDTPSSPTKKILRYPSISSLKSGLISRLNPNKTSRGSTDQQSSHGGTSVSPTTSPTSATRVGLKHSLIKPLPQAPSESSYSTSPEIGRPAIGGHQSGEELHTRSLELNMDSNSNNMESSSSAAEEQLYGNQDQYMQDVMSSMSNLASSVRQETYDDEDNEEDDDGDRDGLTPRSTGPESATPSPAVDQGEGATGSTAGIATQGSSHLSGLMCNVHRTTGREPPPLVGATTTILGDKLYVFGGRILSRSRPAPLTSDLYELDLISRHWTKLQTGGDVPPPRYFHSMCALGDTKMVCYGGMSPAITTSQAASEAEEEQQAEVTVMSDIYIYDVGSRKWTYVPAQDAPQGRYAHCACILPSATSFSSSRAPLAALQHNMSSTNPNEGRIGVNVDGSGGAEMIIVGGQDGANHYIEQISVFNLRSLKWTSTQPLGKSCGAYRSVAAPLPTSVFANIGKACSDSSHRGDAGGIGQESRETGSSMLIYSNYNFLDVKLELQIRSSDGTLTEKPMAGLQTPPGLRFPNGGVIDSHLLVSGTYLTSSKQEYALWALDLRTLVWSRIDAGGGVFGQGSWNRGVLWNRRNAFVILGSRKRSLVDDYNHRRINFTNVCTVELEAFGFYDNPRKTSPMSGFVSASSPFSSPGSSLTRKAGYTAAGRYHSRASEELGDKALAMRELADMDILCIGGERIPVNSRIVSRRWGPYFIQLLREGTALDDGSDAATLRSGFSNRLPRTSASTMMSNSKDGSQLPPSSSGASVLSASNGGPGSSTTTGMSGSIGTSLSDAASGQGDGQLNAAPTSRSLPPSLRPRCLYLPHTYLTVQALLHFLYKSSLPPPTSPLCTPQILCSLLQISRPYRIDGLLEAVIERLHGLLDSRNAAAIFNATAMAAGGGRGIDGSLNPNFFISMSDPVGSPTSVSDFSIGGTTANESSADLAAVATGLSINTNMPKPGRPLSGEISASTSISGSDWSVELGASDADKSFVWTGERSSVIGLQKRGLRGLMEGRRMRERNGTGMGMDSVPRMGDSTGSSFPLMQQGGGGQRVGLGIADS